MNSARPPAGLSTSFIRKETPHATFQGAESGQAQSVQLVLVVQTRHIRQLLLALHSPGARDGRHRLLAVDLALGLVLGEAPYSPVGDRYGVVVLVVDAVQFVGGVVGVVGPAVVGGRPLAAVLVVEFVVAAGAWALPLQIYRQWIVNN